MQTFDSIASGDISAAQARAILNQLPRKIEEPVANRLFAAFRGWTWKALDRKRRDPELREWHDVIKRAQVRTRSLDKVAGQFQVLLDLIYECVAVADRRPVGDVLQRRHVRDLLTELSRAPHGHLRKSTIMGQLGVKDANLSRLMNVVIGAGLVERFVEGREALFRLSKTGEQQLIDLRSHSAAVETDLRVAHDETELAEIAGVWLEIVSLQADGALAPLADIPVWRSGPRDGPLGPWSKISPAEYRDEAELFGKPNGFSNIAIAHRAERFARLPSDRLKLVAPGHE